MTNPAASSGENLGELLLRTARTLRRSSADALAPLGTNPHQGRALRVIAREQPLRPSTLAELLHVNPRSATDNVDNLVAAGWVSRSPDPDDRRATLLELTPLGREVVEQVNQIRAREHARVFEVLDAADREELQRILLLLNPAGPQDPTD